MPSPPPLSYGPLFLPSFLLSFLLTKQEYSYNMETVQAAAAAAGCLWTSEHHQQQHANTLNGVIIIISSSSSSRNEGIEAAAAAVSVIFLSSPRRSRSSFLSFSLPLEFTSRRRRWRMHTRHERIAISPSESFILSACLLLSPLPSPTPPHQ